MRFFCTTSVAVFNESSTHKLFAMSIMGLSSILQDCMFINNLCNLDCSSIQEPSNHLINFAHSTGLYKSAFSHIINFA